MPLKAQAMRGSQTCEHSRGRLTAQYVPYVSPKVPLVEAQLQEERLDASKRRFGTFVLESLTTTVILKHGAALDSFRILKCALMIHCFKTDV